MKEYFDKSSVIFENLYTALIDKDDILPALREGVKVLREGETAKFLFPSFLCYGYIGDFNKIGINQPLIITINLLKHFKD